MNLYTSICMINWEEVTARRTEPVTRARRPVSRYFKIDNDLEVTDNNGDPNP